MKYVIISSMLLFSILLLRNIDKIKANNEIFNISERIATQTDFKAKYCTADVKALDNDTSKYDKTKS